MISRRIPDHVWTIILPACFFVFAVVVEHVFGYTCFTACEDGPIENFEALVLFAAFAFGIQLFRKSRGVYPQWARVFFMLGTLGALYAALEEISYGQRIFGWITPESWDLVNDQHETNLHNTSAWLDQKPRLILEIGVFIGGIVIPLLRKFRPQSLPQKWALVYPADALFPTAFFAIGIHAYHFLTEAAGRQDLFMVARGSEMQETYLFWFILLYLWFKKREITVSTAL